MKLVIAEKPQLGTTIAQAIGIQSKDDGFITCHDDTVVTWCIGHILENAPPQTYDEKYAKWRIEDLPMRLRPLKLQVKDATKKQFATVKKLLQKADSVINAGDFDDEGQLLIQEVLDYCSYRGDVQRLIINDLNVAAVKKALSKLESNDKFQGMYKKALARSQADYIFGLNLSRAYTLAAQSKGNDGVFSIGRVQTPTLGLIVRRYLENKEHKGVFYHVLDGEFDFDGNTHQLKLTITEEIAGNPEKRILEKDTADTIKAACDNQAATVTSNKITEEQVKAPLPFALLDLQAKMNSGHGYSADKTLKITQSLREKHKAITYNRSDCRYLSSEQLSDAPKTLEFVFSVLPDMKSDMIDVATPSRAFDDTKITAHTGIIPVPAHFEISALTAEERVVYEAIVRQYLVQFCPDKTYDKCSVQVDCAGYQYTQQASKVTAPGWSVVLSDATNDDDSDDEPPVDFEKLSTLKAGSQGTCQKVVITTKKTKPQPIYTEATLLKDLQRVAKYVKDPKIRELLVKKDAGRIGENGGIGTPATRSAIIRNLHDKGYFTYQGKKIIPTDKGIDLIKVLPEAIVNPDLTALWFEQQLEIESGSLSVDTFLDDIDSFVAQEVEAARRANILAKGAIICPDCKTGIMKVRKSANGSFLACSNYPQCKYTESLLADKPMPTCPCCGSKFKANSKAISCTNCDLTIWRTVASLALKDTQILDLIEKGKTKPIKGFKSKAGKDFEASLLIDKDKRAVSFDFGSSGS